MKNLIKIMGVSSLVALSFNSFNLNAQYKSFLKEDYEKYCMTYALADLNGDSIHDVVVVDYDLNKNGKKDVRGLFIITGKGDLRGNYLTYYTDNRACMLILDRNEDGIDDEVLADSDLNGVLDKHRFIKDVKKSKHLVL